MSLWVRLGMAVWLAGGGCAGLRLEAAAEDDYLVLFSRMGEADRLVAAGGSDQALEAYRQIQADLAGFQQQHPDWYPDVVAYRLRYVAGRVEALTATNASPADAPAPAVLAVEVADPVALLQQRLRQLSADKELLEARLREALSAAAAAPRVEEQQRAEAQIRALQAELESLRMAAVVKLPEAREPASVSDAALRAKLEVLEKELGAERTRLAALDVARRTLESRVQELEAENRRLGQQPRSPAPPEVAARRLQALMAEAERPSATAPRSTRPGGVDPSGVAGANTNVTPGAVTRSPLVVLVLAQMDRGDFEGARQVLVTAEPSDETRQLEELVRGREAVRRGSLDEAMKPLSRAAQGEAVGAEAGYELARVFMTKGMADAAESLLRRSLELRPGYGRSHYALALLCATRADPDLAQARAHYAGALRAGEPADPQLETALGLSPAADRGAATPSAGAPK